MNFQILSVPQLQAFVRANSIECSDRRRRDALEAAISAWESAKASTIAAATEIKSAMIECSSESFQVAETAEVKATELAVKIVEVLTSPEAVALYKFLFKFVAIVVVFSVLMPLRLVRWCWTHRSDTALYHWVKGAVESRSGQAALYAVLMTWWVVSSVWESIGECGSDR